MESRSVCLGIQLGYPGRKHLFSKQRTSIANPRKRWNPVPVTLAQMPSILSSSCVLGVVDVVGKREDMSLFEKWQRIIDILKDILKPAPNSPAAGGDLTGFFSASAILLLIFWLGNYVVPDLIFKDTVFKEKDSSNDVAKSSLAASEENLASNENVKRERKAIGFGSRIKSKKKKTKR